MCFKTIYEKFSREEPLHLDPTLEKVINEGETVHGGLEIIYKTGSNLMEKQVALLRMGIPAYSLGKKGAHIPTINTGEISINKETLSQCIDPDIRSILLKKS